MLNSYMHRLEPAIAIIYVQMFHWTRRFFQSLSLHGTCNCVALQPINLFGLGLRVILLVHYMMIDCQPLYKNSLFKSYMSTANSIQFILSIHTTQVYKNIKIFNKFIKIVYFSFNNNTQKRILIN